MKLGKHDRLIDGVVWRTCTKCGVEKRIREFIPNRKQSMGKGSWCYTCHRESQSTIRRAKGVKPRKLKKLEAGARVTPRLAYSRAEVARRVMELREVLNTPEAETRLSLLMSGQVETTSSPQ